jgi:rare lipoprotein A
VTWYGPGFYGNRTACGVRYSRDIVGVAHRTLPCGTLVEFKWHGITAVAPVIDRGPFASSDYVFDFSAAMSCEVFKPRGIDNACFTRYDVKYRVVGKVALKSYLRRQ